MDASIILGYKPPQINTPNNALAKLLQVQEMQQMGRARDMEMADREEQRAKSNRLQGLLSQFGDSPDLPSQLTRGGFIEQANTVQKNRVDAQKAQTEQQAKQFDVASKRLEIMGQTFGYVRQNPTPENAMNAIQFLSQQGIMTPEQAQEAAAQIQADPSKVGQLADMAFRSVLSAKEQLPKMEVRDTGGAVQTLQIDPITGQQTTAASIAKTQSPDSIASNATTRRGQDITVRGQDLTNARGIEANAIAAQTRADKPLTDAQSKANLFGTRMQEADRIIAGLEGKYSPMAVNAKVAAGEVPLVGGVAGYAGNLMLSAEGQQAEQAQRDFINAVLRRESGAVISPSEFANAKQQYFPQQGDSKELIAQKANNRKLAISGMEVEVPGGFKRGPSLTSTGQSTGGASGSWGDSPKRPALNDIFK